MLKIAIQGSSKATVALLLLLTVPLLAGCSRDFEQVYQATKLRVFGIKADKPMLKPGESTLLTAVTYVPPGNPTPTYKWSWCPIRTFAKNAHKCPIKRETIVDVLAKRYPGIPIRNVFPSLELGDKSTATFTYPGNPEGVKVLCEMISKAAGEAASKLGVSIPSTDCSKTYEVSIRLVVRSGDQEVIATKRIALWTGGDEKEVNHNPEIVGIQIRPERLEDAERLRAAGATWIQTGATKLEDLWHTVLPTTDTPVVKNGRFVIRSVVDLNSVERWTPPKKFGATETPEPQSEAIQFSWFINRADIFEYEQSKVYREGKTDITQVSNTQWQPGCTKGNNNDASPPGCDPIRIWSVVRDGRLGMDWTERRFTVSGSVPKEEEDDD